MAFDQKLYSISDVQETSFINNEYINQYPDKSYFQLLIGDQTSSGSSSGVTYFDNRFTVPYNVSCSANYNLLGYFMRHCLENNWNIVAIQTSPGIWKTPSLTSGQQSIATRFQGFGFTNYYYQDEIANSTFKLYFQPLTAGVTSSVTTLQNQKVLRFMETREQTFGPSFAVTSGTALINNLSGTTTALTVELYFRPVPQDGPGYLWHRWTTFGGQPIDTYAGAQSGTSSAYPFYSGSPYYGVGCYFNKLVPVTNTDVESPYIDFFVYGALSGLSDHYLDLYSGLIDQNTNSRFLLDATTLATIFDGSFHSLKSVWSTDPYYCQGRLYLDGIEIPKSSITGDGRIAALNYTVTGAVCATPFYFLSHHDNPKQINIQHPTKYSAYSETKHILVFNTPITGTYLSSSSVSGGNTGVSSYLSGTTANLACWFGFNSVSSSYSANDLSSTFGAIGNVPLIGNIVNDTSVPAEGIIAPIYSLITDRIQQFVTSDLDIGVSGGYQQAIGRLYFCEYDQTLPYYMGVIFYSRGFAFLLDDGYNTDYNYSTQLFTSSPSGQFSFVNSSSSWLIGYLSFASRQYVNRKTFSITANANHFAKSTNPSSLFKGTDGQLYTKTNKKFITGIQFYSKNGTPMAQSKFSEPIFKDENESLSVQIIFDN